MTRILLPLPLILLCGCALIPSSKTSTSDAKQANAAAANYEAMIKKIVEGQPSPNIYVFTSGSSNVVHVTPPTPSEHHETIEYDGSGGVTSESSFVWSKFSKNVIPWGIRLLLAAAGIFAVIWAIKYARRTSPAIDAAVSAGERATAAVIHKAEESIEARIRQHREEAAKSTDPSVIAEKNGRIAALREDQLALHKRS